MIVYPKSYLNRKELEKLLQEEWNQEDYVVLERRDGSLRLRGLNEYLGKERQPRRDLSQLLKQEQQPLI